MDRWGGYLYAVSLWVFVPVFIAKVIVRASWLMILVAYGIWVLLLAVFALTLIPAGTVDEALGWPMILSFFLTIPAITLIALVLKIRGAFLRTHIGR